MKYRITEVHQQWRIEQYLKKELQLSAAQIRSLKFRENAVQKNGQRCRVSEMLKAGDVLEVALESGRGISQKVEPSGELPEILYEDADLIGIWKPQGKVTHPVAGHRKDTASGDLATYFQQKKEAAGIHSIGRLDKDTAGILIFAKHSVAAARLWQQKEEGRFTKEYLAWCEGQFAETTQGRWQMLSAPIGKAATKQGTGQRMQVCEEGKRAVTWYCIRKEMAEQTLVQLRLETGRTHQIRVHMAYLGHPLVGDPLYGNGMEHQTQAALCAWKTTVYQPFTGKKIVLQAPEEKLRMFLLQRHQSDPAECRNDIPFLPI